MLDLAYQHDRRPQQRPNHSNFKCVRPGRYPDPRDCRLYYECVKFGQQRHQIQRYVRKCELGKVFSYQRGGICTHPQKSGRVECGYSQQNQWNHPGNNFVSDTLDKTSITRERGGTEIPNDKADTSHVSNVWELKHSGETVERQSQNGTMESGAPKIPNEEFSYEKTSEIEEGHVGRKIRVAVFHRERSDMSAGGFYIAS